MIKEIRHIYSAGGERDLAGLYRGKIRGIEQRIA